MKKVEMLGTLGGLCLAICGIPQAIHCFQTGNAHGITWGLIILWWLGEVITTLYLHLTNSLTLGLKINYFSNILFTSIVFYFKLFPHG
jgi:uncharacterized protein with PQ loop repeat